MGHQCFWNLLTKSVSMAIIKQQTLKKKKKPWFIIVSAIFCGVNIPNNVDSRLTVYNWTLGEKCVVAYYCTSFIAYWNHRIYNLKSIDNSILWVWVF